MRILAVPRWSFAREGSLRRKFRQVLEHPLIDFHQMSSDEDLNRTITAFSGTPDVVADMVFRLALKAMDVIDLNRHNTTVNRLGALDSCPFILLEHVERPEMLEALVQAENLAGRLAASFGVPIFLYEKSDRGRHEADIAWMRKVGFGGISDIKLNPDFGPSRAHPKLGVTVLGVREYMIQLHIKIASTDIRVANALKLEIGHLRQTGDERFLGVRAMSAVLPSQEETLLGLQLTMPDVTEVDPVILWAENRLLDLGLRRPKAYLVGGIRATDMETATRLRMQPRQVIEPDQKTGA